MYLKNISLIGPASKEGSMLGSLEFCTSTLGTRLIVVLGHTQCSAIKGATKMFLESGGRRLSGAVTRGFIYKSLLSLLL